MQQETLFKPHNISSVTVLPYCLFALTLADRIDALFLCSHVVLGTVLLWVGWIGFK